MCGCFEVVLVILELSVAKVYWSFSILDWEKKILILLVMKFTWSKAFWTSLYYTIWFEHSFIVLILCFKYMVFVAVAISNVAESVCFSCMRVNDNGNGLEFVEFVVHVNFFILLGSRYWVLLCWLHVLRHFKQVYSICYDSNMVLLYCTYCML